MHRLVVMHRTALALTILLATTGCVSKGKYDDAVADARAAEAKTAATERRFTQELGHRAADIAKLRSELFALEKASRACQMALDASTNGSRQLQKQLDDATAMNQQLREELTRLGRDVDKLLSDKGYLSSALTDAKNRLEELRRAQAAAEARAALFRQLALKFQKMIDAGELAIALREGRMTLQLPNDVLFDSGRTAIKPAGKEALQHVANVLRTIEGRRFQVAGHTDNEPIRQSPYASNWDLSTARGLAVVDFLVKSGVAPTALSAAGYGEFDPIATNDSPSGMARNRRIEIVLQPNIDEFVTVPDAPSGPAVASVPARSPRR